MSFEGCDISEHQGDLPPEWFDQWAFTIIRAYNENGYPDRTFAQNWERAAGRTLRGVYGWPIPGGDNPNLGAQLVATAPDAEFGYWADVEHSARGIVSPDEVEYYLLGIGDRLRGFYSNIGECPRTAMLDAEHWWMADFGPNNGMRHDPFEQAPVPQRGWTIHQYSSGTGLDLNYAESLDFAGNSQGGFLMALTDDEQRFVYNVLHSMWAGENPGAPGADPLIPPGPFADMLAAAKKTNSGQGGGPPTTGKVTGTLTIGP